MKLKYFLNQLTQNPNLERSQINFIRFTYTADFFKVKTYTKKYSLFDVSIVKLNHNLLSKYVPEKENTMGMMSQFN